MASTFTWLDYSEYERRKMLDVIELFGERTTRDELGLGGVRDAFADLLFPGTSTIQTRARYFLFVPWAYLLLEQRETKSATVAVRLRKLETETMRAIAESHDTAGLIGRLAKEKVQRLPSSIYWQGLFVWGIRLFSGSQDEYHRSLDVFYARRKARRAPSHEFDGEAPPEPDLHNWHPGLPSAPDGFPQTASFTLERHEAEYLRERILSSCPKSLLAHLVRERIPVADLDFAWNLSADWPDDLREILSHGRCFSEIIYGVQLLYNLMLADLCNWQEKIDEYRSKLDVWCQVMLDRWDEFQRWDRRRFWQIVSRGNPRVSSRARHFINQWIEIVLGASSPEVIVENSFARQLVEHREGQLKGGLARLRSQRARELWPGAAGAVQLDLRWTSTRGIVADILAALESQSNA